MSRTIILPLAAFLALFASVAKADFTLGLTPYNWSPQAQTISFDLSFDGKDINTGYSRGFASEQAKGVVLNLYIGTNGILTDGVGGNSYEDQKSFIAYFDSSNTIKHDWLFNTELDIGDLAQLQHVTIDTPTGITFGDFTWGDQTIGVLQTDDKGNNNGFDTSGWFKEDGEIFSYNEGIAWTWDADNEVLHLVAAFSFDGYDWKTPITSKHSVPPPIRDFANLLVDNETLDIQQGTLINITDDNDDYADVIIRNGGILRLDSTAPTDTGIVKKDSLDNKVNITVENGKIESYRTDNSTDETAPHHGGGYINTKIVGSAEVKVADGVTLVTGELTDAGKAATITKTGNGTYKTVGVANLTESTLHVEEGTFIFDKDAVVKNIDVETGLIFNGNATVDTVAVKSGANLSFNKNLNIYNGGTIVGTMNGAGNLIKTAGGTLAIQEDSSIGQYLVIANGTVEYGKEDKTASFHSAGAIGIASGATLDVKQGALVNIAGDNEQYKDVIVEGTLRLDSTNPTGSSIVKKGSLNNKVNITVADGKIESYRTDNSTDEITPHHGGDHINTKIVGSAEVKVADGVTLVTGELTDAGTAAMITKTGNGTYKTVAEATLAKSAINVKEGKLIFANKATVDTVAVQSGANLQFDAATTGINKLLVAGNVVANANQTFGSLNLPGKYHGNGNNLTLKNGGEIAAAGTITNVGNFTTNGDLTIQITNGSSTPVLTANTLSIGGNAKIYLLGEGSHQNVITTKETNLTALRDKFYQGSALQTLNIREHSVSVNVSTAKDYFAGDGGNAQNVGEELDRNFNTAIGEGVLQQLNAEQLNSLVQQGLAGETAANAMQTVTIRPTGEIFSYLNDVSGLADAFGSFTQNTETRGQVRQREERNLWFTSFVRYEKADKDELTFDGYTNTHVGMLVGADWKIYNKCLLGAAFGYGAPRIKSGASELKTDDFSFGLYYRMPVIAQLYTNMYLGYGSQSYTLEGLGTETKYNGDSITGSIQFMRDFRCSKLKLTPLLGFEFSTLKTDAFDVGLFRIADNKFNQTRAKVGLNTEWRRFRTRLSYTTLLGGDKVGLTDVSFADTGAGTRVRGLNMGTDWFSVGVGGKVLEWNRLKIFADYDFDTSKHLTGHTGQLQAALSW